MLRSTFWCRQEQKSHHTAERVRCPWYRKTRLRQPDAFESAAWDTVIPHGLVAPTLRPCSSRHIMKSA